MLSRVTNFCVTGQGGRTFRRDAETNTRAACVRSSCTRLPATGVVTGIGNVDSCYSLCDPLSHTMRTLRSDPFHCARPMLSIWRLCGCRKQDDFDKAISLPSPLASDRGSFPGLIRSSGYIRLCSVPRPAPRLVQSRCRTFPSKPIERYRSSTATYRSPAW